MASSPPSEFSPHARTLLKTLQESDVPLTAYALLERARAHGIKAPPTVYRALEQLIQRGQVHRIESLNAFIACHHPDAAHAARFAVCRACGTATEIHDSGLNEAVRTLSAGLRFQVEREMLELLGLCNACTATAGSA